ncbi:Hypothetical_protein [Hexamita inflata]|uniref:Hypothetical_protein n=1 Tax=Hexamita inflata TaxID=28002 RepID=A0AA86UQI6_9EUKA|nr:Hypothetical protein HINF_LOCUS55380 [Hexamita inflata]
MKQSLVYNNLYHYYITYNNVFKDVLQPQHKKYESNNQPDIQPQINQVQLPVLDEFFTIHENQITLPQILEENNQPLITDIRPDYLDSFHQIKPLVYDTYTGPLQHQPTNTNELVLQPATVENKLII